MATIRQKKQQRDWYERNAPGTGVIGLVPKLAQEAINPMWATEASVIALSEEYAETISTLTPKKVKSKMVSVSSKGQYLVKVEEITEE